MLQNFKAVELSFNPTGLVVGCFAYNTFNVR